MVLCNISHIVCTNMYQTILGMFRVPEIYYRHFVHLMSLHVKIILYFKF